jgi:hypothetical protein
MGIISVVLFWLVYRGMVQKLDPVEIVISEETTWLTGPVLEDDTVDYFGHIQGVLSAGVTEQNNAMRDLLELTGGEAIPAKVRPQVWEALSLNPDLLEQDLYEDLVDFADGLAAEELPASLQISAEARARIEKLKKQIREQIDQYGSPPPQMVEEYLQAREGSVTDAVMGRLETANRRTWTDAEYPFLARWLDRSRPLLEKVAQATRKERFYLPPVDFSEIRPSNLITSLRIPREALKEMGMAMLALSLRNVESEKMGQSLAWAMATHRLGRLLGQGWSVQSTEASVYLEHAAARALLVLVTCPQAQATFLGEAQEALGSIKPRSSLVDDFNQGGRLLTLDYTNLEYRGKISFDQTLDPDKLRDYRADYDWNLARGVFNDWFDQFQSVVATEDMQLRREQASQLEDRMSQWLIEKEGEFRERQGLWGRLQSMVEDPTARREEMSQWLAARMLDGTLQVLSMRWALVNTLSEAEARRRLALLSAALRRRKAAMGAYPQRIESLVPKYLEAMPVDPFSQKTMIYAQTENGFSLYSVGRNLEDDAGDQARDIVVTYPSDSP